MGKGSRPRPYSVSLKDFDSTYDTVFGKKDAKPRWVPPPLPDDVVNSGNKDMIKEREELSEVGKCGCGRSPTGKCIGWHGLSEEMFQARKAEFEAHEQNNLKDSTQGG